MKNIMFSSAAMGKTMNLDLDSGSSREWSKNWERTRAFSVSFQLQKQKLLSHLVCTKIFYLQIFLILFLVISNSIRNCFELYWQIETTTARVFIFATIGSRRKSLLTKSWPKRSPKKLQRQKKISLSYLNREGLSQACSVFLIKGMKDRKGDLKM